jgi:transposase
MHSHAFLHKALIGACMGIADIAASGDRIKTLEAVRDKLATDLDVAPATVTAQLASQLSKVLAELAELGASTKVSALDELASKRTNRLAAAGIPDTPRRPARKPG